MIFDELMVFQDERMVVERIKDSPNQIVFYGAANCAESLYQAIAPFKRFPCAVFVDDAYCNSNTTFHGLRVQPFREVVQSIKQFDVAVAIGTQSPRIDHIEALSQVSCVFPNVGYARGPAMDKTFVMKHWNDFRHVFDMFADDLSKKSFVALLDSKMYGNLKAFTELKEINQYFGLDFMPLSRSEILVDCGAYTGDSIRWFLEKVQGQFEKIYAWEPDPGNFIELVKYIETAALNNVIVFRSCAFSKQGSLCFDSQGTMTSFITGSGIASVPCDTIDNCCGDATLIKMDVEGSEMEALSGAIETIKKHKPKLAVAVYHRREDIIEIPKFIQSIREDYKFYLRIHREVADDVILYAI